MRTTAVIAVTAAIAVCLITSADCLMVLLADATPKKLCLPQSAYSLLYRSCVKSKCLFPHTISVSRIKSALPPVIILVNCSARLISRLVSFSRPVWSVKKAAVAVSNLTTLKRVLPEEGRTLFVCHLGLIYTSFNAFNKLFCHTRISTAAANCVCFCTT